jgi:Mn2+ and Fe2+ transporters of the NRAMP family
VLRWLTLSLGAYIAVLFVIDVDWRMVLRSTFIPSLSWTPAELAALIAILGTTISPYLFFWQTSEEVEELTKSGETSDVDPGHMRHMRADIFAGMGSAVLVMFAIMVASAATLGSAGITTVRTAAEAAAALKPLAGSFASLLFTLGIVGTGLLAVPVLAGSTAYAITEAVGRPEGLGRSFGRARVFYGVIAAAMLLGLGMDFVGLDPVRALYFAAILNGLAAPPLILLMLLLSRTRDVCGDQTGGRLSTAFVVVALVLMTALPLIYLLVRCAERGPRRVAGYRSSARVRGLQAIVVVGEFLQVGPGDLARDQRIVVRHVGLRIMSPVLELYVQSTPEHIHVERGTVDIETDQGGYGPRLHLRETTPGACVVVVVG